MGAPADHHHFTLTRILSAFALRGLIERFEATLIDALGRRSYTTSIAFGPTLGKNIALAYLPHAYAQLGRELQIQYFADVYPVKVEAVGYKPLYDAENVKLRS